jgi:protein phosphatase methylesterase 1
MSIPPLLKNKDGKYIWAMDLKKTVDYWDDWFTGLSKNFVNAPTSKLLILAGTDNLDKELMIGQMQGKYQLVVFQDSGHFIQEDVPKKAAVTLLDFWERNDRDQTVIKSTWGSNK